MQGVPDEGAVTLPASAVRRWLEEEGMPSNGHENGKPDVADLTVKEIAEELGKSTSTVRGWMPDVPGSYQLGAEWRVSRENWRAYLDSLADDEEDEGPAEVRSSRSASLQDWRDQ